MHKNFRTINYWAAQLSSRYQVSRIFGLHTVSLYQPRLSSLLIMYSQLQDLDQKDTHCENFFSHLLPQSSGLLSGHGFNIQPFEQSFEVPSMCCVFPTWFGAAKTVIKKHYFGGKKIRTSIFSSQGIWTVISASGEKKKKVSD